MRNVCAQQRVPCGGILIGVGRACLGTPGHSFSGDGCSLKATFPRKPTVVLWYLKSLDTENQRKVKRLTRGHQARVEKLLRQRKTHADTHPVLNVSASLADLQIGHNLILRLPAGQLTIRSGGDRFIKSRLEATLSLKQPNNQPAHALNPPKLQTVRRYSHFKHMKVATDFGGTSVSILYQSCRI